MPVRAATLLERLHRENLVGVAVLELLRIEERPG